MPSTPPPGPGLRVGKRLRRKPQRWEGDGLDATRPPRGSVAPSHSSGARHHGNDENSFGGQYVFGASGTEPPLAASSGLAEASNIIADDGDSTCTLRSTDSVNDAPLVDDPVIDMRRAAVACREQQPSRRDIVDAFHSWQKQAVSKQAAQQKALHVYLKRRLRKRTTRLPEIDRAEEDALRNARHSVPLDDEDDTDDGGKTVTSKKRSRQKLNSQDPLVIENLLHRNTIVPSKVRLPLEAYLPRRVRPGKEKLTVEDVMSIVPDPPRLTTALKSQGKTWLVLPTVVASSAWNSRKSGAHRSPNGPSGEHEPDRP